MQNYSGMLVLARGQAAEDKLKIGMISSIDAALGRAKIAFGDFSSANLPAPDILVLKDKNQLYRDLLTSAAGMETADFKAVFKVSMLQDRPGSAALMEALELLKDRPGALELATVSLEQKINGSLEIQAGTERGKAR